MPSKHRCHCSVTIDILKLHKALVILDHLDNQLTQQGASRTINAMLGYFISAAENTLPDQSFRKDYTDNLSLAAGNVRSAGFTLSKATQKYLAKLGVHLDSEQQHNDIPQWQSVPPKTLPSNINLDIVTPPDHVEKINKATLSRKESVSNDNELEAIIKDKGREYWEAIIASGKISNPEFRSQEIADAVKEIYGIDIGGLV